MLLWKITRLIICFVRAVLVNRTGEDVLSSDDARVMSDKNGIGLGLDSRFQSGHQHTQTRLYADEYLVAHQRKSR